jgi:hypothetical protein
MVRRFDHKPNYCDLLEVRIRMNVPLHECDLLHYAVRKPAARLGNLSFRGSHLHACFSGSFAYAFFIQMRTTESAAISDHITPMNNQQLANTCSNRWLFWQFRLPRPSRHTNPRMGMNMEATRGASTEVSDFGTSQTFSTNKAIYRTAPFRNDSYSCSEYKQANINRHMNDWCNFFLRSILG